MCNKMSTSAVYSKSSAMTQKQSNVQLFPTTISSAAKMLKYQHIAPAPLNGGGGNLINTRKYTPRATNAPYNVDQTQSVQRRNARERNRVKQVNNSFAKLRQHIPQTIIADLTKGGGRGPHKKISKVDTLRIAVEYIRRLQDLVDDLNGGPVNSSSNHIMQHDSLSNISFCTSSSSSSMADSPPPSTLPPTTVNAFHYTPLSTSSSTSPPPLPSYQQQFTNIVGGATTSSALLTPVSLHAYNQIDGCASPTSSFNSSMSFDSGTYEPTSSRRNNQQQSSSSSSNEHLNAHLQLKFEPYDNFQLHEEDCQPDDEEILDYISLWQEQQ